MIVRSVGGFFPIRTIKTKESLLDRLIRSG